MNRSKLLDQAQRSIERQQYDRAIRAYKKLLSLDPDDLRVSLKLAEVYLRSQDGTAALTLYHEIASRYLELGNEPKARSVYQLIIKISRRDERAHQFLWRHTLKSGGPEDEATYHLGVLIAHDKLQDNPERRLAERLKAHLEVFPHDLRARRLSAQFSLDSGARSEAIEHLSYLFEHLDTPEREDLRVQVGEELIGLDDQLTSVKFTLCELYVSRGAAKRAMPHLQAIFKRTPSDLDVLLLLGRALSSLGYPEKARRAFESVILASRTRGELERAQESAQILIKLDPDNESARAVIEELERTRAAELSVELHEREDQERQRVQEAEEFESIDEHELDEGETNETGGNEVGGNEVGGNEVGGNGVGGNEVGDDKVGDDGSADDKIEDGESEIHGVEDDESGLGRAHHQSLEGSSDEHILEARANEGSSAYERSLIRSSEALSSGRPEVAFEILRDLLAIDPTRRDALTLLVKVARALNHEELLLSALEALSELEGEDHLATPAPEEASDTVTPAPEESPSTAVLAQETSDTVPSAPEESPDTSVPTQGASDTAAPVPEESSDLADPAPEETSDTATPAPEEASDTAAPAPEESSDLADPALEETSGTAIPAPEEASDTATPAPEEASAATPAPEEASDTAAPALATAPPEFGFEFGVIPEFEDFDDFSGDMSELIQEDSEQSEESNDDKVVGASEQATQHVQDLDDESRQAQCLDRELDDEGQDSEELSDEVITDQTMTSLSFDLTPRAPLVAPKQLNAPKALTITATGEAPSLKERLQLIHNQRASHTISTEAQHAPLSPPSVNSSPQSSRLSLGVGPHVGPHVARGDEKLSARARAHREISEARLAFNQKTFTPAPLKTPGATRPLTSASSPDATQSHASKVEEHSQHASTYLTSDIFAKPREELEVDRAKHSFELLTRETPILSPLTRRPEPSRSSEAQPVASEADQLTRDTAELLRGVELDHSALIRAVELETGSPLRSSASSDVPPYDAVEIDVKTKSELGARESVETSAEIDAKMDQLLGDLWGDDLGLSDDLEDAFMALQTPINELEFVSDPESEIRLNAESSAQLAVHSGVQHLTPAEPALSGPLTLEQLRAPNPELIFELDEQRAQPLELIELTRSLMASAQHAFADDQLAFALLSAKPLASLRYLQALIWIELNELTRGVELLLEMVDEARMSGANQARLELLIKLISTHFPLSRGASTTSLNESSTQVEAWLLELSQLDAERGAWLRDQLVRTKRTP